ncbi:TRAP transporter large permease [Xanthobacteraceae bacterium A53D]
MIALLLIGGFALFLILGVPVAFGIALAGLSAILYQGYPLALFGQRLFTSVDSFALMAIPLFMLAGSLMGHGGITRRIISLALALVGNIRGSLAHVVSTSGVVMGGVSGSGVADVAALGSVMIPEMKKRNYDVGFSAALVASSGSLALILPPSIALILYGVSNQASIGDLFMAGIAPGLLLGFLFAVYSYWFAVKNGYPTEGRVSWAEKGRRFLDASWALAMPVIIIGGIRMGVFTPTEGGAVVAVYAFVVGAFVYKELTLASIPKVCIEAAIGTAVIASIIAATSLFGWLLTNAQLPQAAAQAILSITENKILILLLINIMLLVVGMFLDSGPAILLMTPILGPVAAHMGVDPVQFGMIMVINLTIGLLTPPVGTALYLASSIAGISVLRLSVAMLPFVGIMLFVLGLVTYVPEFTSWAISK